MQNVVGPLAVIVGGDGTGNTATVMVFDVSDPQMVLGDRLTK